MRRKFAASSLPLRPARSHEEEWMDLPNQDPALVDECLNDLRRLNRFTGGISLTVFALTHLTLELAPGSDIEILDVATGGGDFPRAMAAWARRRGLRARILATDLSPEILGWAATDAPPDIEFAVADARFLPFDDEAFDVATCSLLLHHLEPAAAAATLKEMRRVARRGVIVNDIVRSWVGYLGGLVVPRMMSRNPLFRHDAPLSVRRAYTKDELTTLADQAGLEPVHFRGLPGYRVTMTAAGSP